MNIRQLAKEAGCSPATVSRVLNDFPYINMELRKKVIAAAQKFNYAMKGRSFLILIPEELNFCGYLGLILGSLLETAKKRNFNITIMRESDLENIGGAFLFDGCIAVICRPELEKSWGKKYAVPIVCINSYGNYSDNVYNISSDNCQGIFLAMDHFVRKGHKKIAFISLVNPKNGISKDIIERQSYYEEYMINNIPSEKPLHISCLCGQYKIYHELLQKNITALLIPGEGYVPYIYQDLKRANIKIPDDLSIITMEHDYLSRAITPEPTAIKQDWQQIAESAFDLLLKQQSNQQIKNRQIPYRLIERATVRDVTHSN